jgi:hypothetical protein
VSQYGEGVHEPRAHSGLVSLAVEEPYGPSAGVSIHPDEARLLALRLIKMADEAEGQEW